MNDILEILKYTVPSAITGLVAAYFLKQYVNEESNKRRFEMFGEKKKQSLPIRLQAYERMTLFIERMELENITNRVLPFEANKIEYAQMLITQINSEFEHNLVQQIYVSADCWKLIKNAKQTTLNIITAQSMKENITSGLELQQALQQVLKEEKENPITLAQEYVQKEVHQLF